MRAASCAVVLVIGACSLVTDDSGTDELPATTPPPVTNGERVELVRVDDGDSLVVRTGDEEVRLRLIGVNAPERGECLDAEATEALKDLVTGHTIEIEADADPFDRFGRLLRYVWADGELVNAEMARHGLAIARAFPPNVARQDTLEDAEAEAREARVGLWDPTACGGDPSVALEIREVSANPPGRDEDNLNGEFVVIVNEGAEPVDLSGFVLRDGSSVHRFTFPDGVTAHPGAALTIHVGCGEDDATDLYWCRGTPVWDNAGDQAFLIDRGGAIVATHEYPDRG